MTGTTFSYLMPPHVKVQNPTPENALTELRF